MQQGPFWECQHQTNIELFGAAATYTRGFTVNAGDGGLTNTTANLLQMSTGGTAITTNGIMTFSATSTGGITVNSSSVISVRGGIEVNSSGAGVVTLSGASNTYTGTTTISQGTLSADTIVVTATKSGIGNASSAVILDSPSTAGTLSYTGSAATYVRGFTVNAGGGGLTNTTGNLLQLSTVGTTVASGGTMTFMLPARAASRSTAPA
ncbi:MAG: autotransporter-associated beta strand repeat-containing protein [Hyphomicrobium sp.]|uniref:autotransporter-associated beta strand repeat-containing protein n=1 Tax=Hyphomicrobium sp. TaxID=82 RepID=UPI0039E5B7C3